MVDSPTPNTAALVPSSSNVKRLSTIGKGPNDQPANGSPVKSRSTPAPGASANTAKDVVSPAELCGFVDTLLSQLETKFDDMSEQLLSRMDNMSARIDSLENSIQDLMQDGIEGGAGHGMSPSSPPSAKR